MIALLLRVDFWVKITKSHRELTQGRSYITDGCLLGDGSSE